MKPITRLLLLLAAGLLSGCASEQRYSNGSLTDDAYQFLYPRQYYDSLGTWERKVIDQQTQQDEVKRQRQSR